MSEVILFQFTPVSLGTRLLRTNATLGVLRLPAERTRRTLRHGTLRGMAVNNLATLTRGRASHLTLNKLPRPTTTLKGLPPAL